MVASGASITMMDTELMEYLPELRSDMLTPGNHENLRSIDGSLILSAGNLKVNLNLNGENVKFGGTLNHENLRSIDSSLILSAGNLKVNMNLNGENVEFGDTLCQPLYVPFILGVDFLSQNDATLDYYSNVVQIGSSQLPMYSDDIRPHVSLPSNVILPPLSATAVAVPDREIMSSEAFGKTSDRTRSASFS